MENKMGIITLILLATVVIEIPTVLELKLIKVKNTMNRIPMRTA